VLDIGVSNPAIGGRGACVTEEIRNVGVFDQLFGNE
jgi:hypothetical protein